MSCSPGAGLAFTPGGRDSSFQEFVAHHRPILATQFIAIREAALALQAAHHGPVPLFSLPEPPVPIRLCARRCARRFGVGRSRWLISVDTFRLAIDWRWTPLTAAQHRQHHQRDPRQTTRDQSPSIRSLLHRLWFSDAIVTSRFLSGPYPSESDPLDDGPGSSLLLGLRCSTDLLALMTFTCMRSMGAPVIMLGRVPVAWLLLMVLLLGVSPARADSEESYWFGFTLGSGMTICELLHARILSPDLTREFLKGVRSRDSIPAVAKTAAFVELEKLYPQCPLK